MNLCYSTKLQNNAGRFIYAPARVCGLSYNAPECFGPARLTCVLFLRCRFQQPQSIYFPSVPLRGAEPLTGHLSKQIRLICRIHLLFHKFGRMLNSPYREPFNDKILGTILDVVLQFFYPAGMLNLLKG